MKKSIIALLTLFLTFSGILTAQETKQELFKNNVTASFYADKFDGRKTVSGEIFNMNELTAAHKTLPFGTVVKVTNLENGKAIEVRINDRGPFIEGREIDVSKAAAVKLDMIQKGTAQVSIEIVKVPESIKETPTQVVEKAKEEEQTEQKWVIQIGAFSVEANAHNLVQGLLKAGYSNVGYQKTPNLTRVVINDVKTAEMDAILTRLEKDGYTQYYIQEPKKK